MRGAASGGAGLLKNQAGQVPRLPGAARIFLSDPDVPIATNYLERSLRCILGCTRSR